MFCRRCKNARPISSRTCSIELLGSSNLPGPFLREASSHAPRRQPGHWPKANLFSGYLCIFPRNLLQVPAATRFLRSSKAGLRSPLQFLAEAVGKFSADQVCRLRLGPAELIHILRPAHPSVRLSIGRRPMASYGYSFREAMSFQPKFRRNRRRLLSNLNGHV